MAETTVLNGANGLNGSTESENPKQSPTPTEVKEAPAFSWLYVPTPSLRKVFS